MIVSFQYRIYPTQEQAIVLDNTLETCRHLYNGALAERIDAYQYEGRTIGYIEQQNQLPILKKTAPPLTELYSQVAKKHRPAFARHRSDWNAVLAGTRTVN